MKAKIFLVIILACFLVAGCESFRFAPSERQKQNAWLHNRTASVAAQTATVEDSSQKLQALTKLNELQSRNFVSYCGLPKEFPKAENAEDILSESSVQIAHAALTDSAERPDAFELADSILELGIGISALLGGVYGTRAVRFLQEAKTKSKALQEIVKGNELFKKEHTALASAFKQAHKDQSSTTRQIVVEMKA